MKYSSIMVHSEDICCIYGKKLGSMSIPQPASTYLVLAIQQKHELRKAALKLSSLVWGRCVSKEPEHFQGTSCWMWRALPVDVWLALHKWHTLSHPSFACVDLFLRHVL